MRIEVDELKSFVENKFMKYGIKFMYLFGSLAKGTDNNMSDIDLAIMFEHKMDKMQEVFIRGEIIEEVSCKFKMPCDVISLNDSATIIKYNVVKDGIVLIDNIDRADFESIALREYWDFKPLSDYYDEMYLKRVRE